MLNNIAALMGAGVTTATTDYESIATVTVGAGGASSVTFSSIAGTYSHLQIRATGFYSAENNPYMRVGNGSVDSGSNYSWHHLYGNGSTPSSNGNTNQTFVYYGYSTNSTYAVVGVIDILDYANTSKYKTMRVLAGQDNSGTGEIALWSGSWRSTSAINTITLTPESGNFAQYSSFALYGIK